MHKYVMRLSLKFAHSLPMLNMTYEHYTKGRRESELSSSATFRKHQNTYNPCYHNLIKRVWYNTLKLSFWFLADMGHFKFTKKYPPEGENTRVGLVQEVSGQWYTYNFIVPLHPGKWTYQFHNQYGSYAFTVLLMTMPAPHRPINKGG